MATKTISITEEAYERLAAKKRGGESFSDVILRTTGKIDLTEFAGILSKGETEKIEKAVKESRGMSRHRMIRIRKELEK